MMTAIEAAQRAVESRRKAREERAQWMATSPEAQALKERMNQALQDRLRSDYSSVVAVELLPSEWQHRTAIREYLESLGYGVDFQETNQGGRGVCFSWAHAMPLSD